MGVTTTKQDQWIKMLANTISNKKVDLAVEISQAKKKKSNWNGGQKAALFEQKLNELESALRKLDFSLF